MKKLIKYLDDNNISLSELSKGTGIAYSVLYDSLAHEKRNRELRARELFKICDYLKVGVDRFK